MNERPRVSARDTGEASEVICAVSRLRLVRRSYLHPRKSLKIEKTSANVLGLSAEER
jgi:hypothetical protein